MLGNLILSPHFVIGTESQWNWSYIHSYLGRDSEARFGQDFEVLVLWRCCCLVGILKLILGRDSENEI